MKPMQSYEQTAKQRLATDLLGGKANHVLLFGGSRSGKTFELIRAMLVRSLKTKSRHVILRKHFNHAKQAIWYDTMPKVMDICYPGIRNQCRFDKSDWFIKFSNGSEIWIGGLDDKERTEKILGKEYSTMFFNECSEISWEARNIAITRLAEKNELKNKAYYDCNPPKRSHWSFKLFVEHLDPLTEAPLNPRDYAAMQMNPMDNLKNIDPDYISSVLEKLPLLLRKRFLEGEFVSDDTDIFRPEWIYPSNPIPERSELCLIVSACDPAMSEKDTACETSISTFGMDYHGIIHELETVSGRYSWKRLKETCKAVNEAQKPDFFGVERVQAQKWLGEELREHGVNVDELEADADKVRRAITVTDLFEQGRVRINDPKTRRQLLEFPPDEDSTLRDRVDSVVYALRLIKRYAEDKYEKPVDRYAGLDARSKQFWQNHEKDLDELQQARGVGANLASLING